MFEPSSESKDQSPITNEEMLEQQYQILHLLNLDAESNPNLRPLKVVLGTLMSVASANLSGQTGDAYTTFMSELQKTEAGKLFGLGVTQEDMPIIDRQPVAVIEED